MAKKKNKISSGRKQAISGRLPGRDRAFLGRLASRVQAFADRGPNGGRMLPGWLVACAPAILVLLTLMTIMIGALFYWDQLSATPPFLWIFVPDCPLYGVLASLLLLWGAERVSGLLRFVVACASAHFGAWTIFVLLAHPGTYFVGSGTILSSVIMLIGHAWMVLAAFLLVPKKTTRWIVLIAVLWLGINTFADYRLGALSTHPWIPTEKLGLVEAYSWLSSLFWPLLLFFSAPFVARVKLIGQVRSALAWRA